MTDANGWRPIESAPNDGRQVWAYGGRFSSPTLTPADGEWWRAWARQLHPAIPTLWAPCEPPPLPPPLTAQEGGR